MRTQTRILSVQNDGYFAPFSRWQEFLRRLCAEQRHAALPSLRQPLGERVRELRIVEHSVIGEGVKERP